MQIDHDLLLLLTGAVIALVSTVIAGLVQHILSLREDRIKRERDGQAKKRENLTAELSLSRVKALTASTNHTGDSWRTGGRRLKMNQTFSPIFRALRERFKRMIGR